MKYVIIHNQHNGHHLKQELLLWFDQAVVDYVSKRAISGSLITNTLVWIEDNQATAEDSIVFLNTLMSGQNG